MQEGAELRTEGLWSKGFDDGVGGFDDASVALGVDCHVCVLLLLGRRAPCVTHPLEYKLSPWVSGGFVCAVSRIGYARALVVRKT